MGSFWTGSLHTLVIAALSSSVMNAALNLHDMMITEVHSTGVQDEVLAVVVLDLSYAPDIKGLIYLGDGWGLVSS
jgi:hypothetical protein